MGMVDMFNTRLNSLKLLCRRICDLETRAVVTHLGSDRELYILHTTTHHNNNHLDLCHNSHLMVNIPVLVHTDILKPQLILIRDTVRMGRQNNIINISLNITIRNINSIMSSIPTTLRIII